MFNLLSSLNDFFKPKETPKDFPYSGTIIDMTFQEIQQAALGGALVLQPISSLEEHGPHLPIGTNTFLTTHLCRKIQTVLWQQNKSTIVAAPVYWGRNHSTGSFPGSFNLTSQTLTNLLLDIFADYQRWKFPAIILINIHADSQHISTLLQTVRQARIQQINIFYPFPEQLLGKYDLNGSEEFLIPYRMPEFSLSSPYIDLHAGSFETSWLSATYPEYVKSELAKTLQPTNSSLEETSVWNSGWDDFQKSFPLGYCGDPGQIDVQKAEEFEHNLVDQISKAIILKNFL